ncbi:MAG: GNAT family N-acetyltransferase [Hominenteromicrobium sp.]
MEIQINTLTSELFLELYGSVGWEPPEKAQAETALQHTLASFTAYDGGKPVGMLRILGDGGMSFYLKDFAVLPAYQGKGVGSLLIDSAEAYIRSVLPANWAVSLELISTKEAVPFYKKKGFEERPCAWDGPGMFKMLR